MYITYSEYNEMGGLLSESEFNRFYYRAKKELDNATFNRLTGLTADDNTKRCMFELITYISENCNNGAVNSVKSISNDGYSVSYSDKTEAKTDIRNIIETYFIETDMMYSGLGMRVHANMDYPDDGWEYLMVKSNDNME